MSEADGSSDATGTSRLVHQFELAMAVRAVGNDEGGMTDELLREIVSDAVRSDRIDRFILRQASLPGIVADVTGHIAGALLKNRAVLEKALAHLDAGQPLAPADVGLDGDSVLRVVLYNIGRDDQGTPPT